MSKLILIVESNPQRAQELRDLCFGLGFDAITSPDGLHGLMRVIQDHPDLILLDPASARLGGSEMAEVAARHDQTAATPIVVLLPSTASALAMHYRSLGVHVAATRPLPELKRTICGLLAEPELEPDRMELSLDADFDTRSWPRSARMTTAAASGCAQPASF